MGMSKEQISEAEKVFKIYMEKRCLQEEPEAGFFCAEDFAAFMNSSIATAHRALRKLLQEGKVEVRRYRVKTGVRVYPVPFYRPVEEKDNGKSSPKRKPKGSKR